MIRNVLKRAVDWPRYLRSRTVKGRQVFYWIPAARDIEAGFTTTCEALGADFEAAAKRARLLNQHLDSWRDGRGVPKELRAGAAIGSVNWWHQQFIGSDVFLRKKSRTQSDYRRALAMIAELPTTVTGADGKPVLTGSLPISSLSLAAVDKIYARLRRGGEVTRQADAAIDVARRAWSVVSRMHPGYFLVPVVIEGGRTQSLAINPFASVERARYARDTATPASREEAYALADALERIGHPALGVGALICFEWLQRPEDVRRGLLTWTDYRPATRPGHVLVWHHKTGARVWTPLDHVDSDGRTTRLYPEIEDRLAALPKLGTSIVLFRPERGPRDASGQRTPRTYSIPYAQHLVQHARKIAGLPEHITFEACRHGGMTELGDLGLTEQETMSLSGHVTPRAARIYVKRTERQRLTAAVKRRKGIEGAKG